MVTQKIIDFPLIGGMTLPMKTTIHNYYSIKIIAVHDMLKLASYIHKTTFPRIQLKEALKRAHNWKTITQLDWDKNFTEYTKDIIVKKLEGIVSLQIDIVKTDVINELEENDYLEIAKKLKNKLDRETIDDITTLISGIRNEEVCPEDVAHVFGYTVYA